MFNYRLTAPLLPIFLLLLGSTFGAYPWRIFFGSSLAMPFLTLLIMLFCALRYPGMLISPVVFLAGLACDLFTNSPLGYWALLFLVALSCARTTTSIVENHSRLAGWLGFFITLIFVSIFAWALASLYQSEWQSLGTVIKGMTMALILLPLPALLLVGLESQLILQRGAGSHGG